MIKFLIMFLLSWFSVFGQDPQTNAPGVMFPLVDEYIKEGFDRNYRAHTRILSQIDYIHVANLSRADPEMFVNEWGSTDTFKVYRYYNNAMGRWQFVLGFNYIWVNNYYVMRRMFFKSIGMISGLPECHKDCKHIMSGRKLMDPVLVFYDAAPVEWEKELNIFYKALKEYTFK